MSNLGVDLLRSDTGHYMEWPPAEDASSVPVIPSSRVAARHATRGRTWIATLAANGAAAPAAVAAAQPTVARAVWVADTRGRAGVTLALVNWLFLLIMFCVFLLAKTLPVDSALTGGSTAPHHGAPLAGSVAQACAKASVTCASPAGR